MPWLILNPCDGPESNDAIEQERLTQGMDEAPANILQTASGATEPAAEAEKMVLIWAIWMDVIVMQTTLLESNSRKRYLDIVPRHAFVFRH